MASEGFSEIHKMHASENLPNTNTVDQSIGFKCAACDNSYRLKVYLNKHMKLCKTCKCPGCDKVYRTKIRLRQHMKRWCKVIMPFNKYKCAKCDMTFAGTYLLQKHQKVHIRKYLCKKCCAWFEFTKYIKHMKGQHPNEEVGRKLISERISEMAVIVLNEGVDTMPHFSRVPDCDATPTVYDATPTYCDVTPTDCDATPTDCDATPTHCDATPTNCDAPPTEVIAKVKSDKNDFCEFYRALWLDDAPYCGADDSWLRKAGGYRSVSFEHIIGDETRSLDIVDVETGKSITIMCEDVLQHDSDSPSDSEYDWSDADNPHACFSMTTKDAIQHLTSSGDLNYREHSLKSEKPVTSHQPVAPARRTKTPVNHSATFTTPLSSSPSTRGATVRVHGSQSVAPTAQVGATLCEPRAVTSAGHTTAKYNHTNSKSCVEITQVDATPVNFEPPGHSDVSMDLIGCDEPSFSPEALFSPSDVPTVSLPSEVGSSKKGYGNVCDNSPSTDGLSSFPFHSLTENNPSLLPPTLSLVYDKPSFSPEALSSQSDFPILSPPPEFLDNFNTSDGNFCNNSTSTAFPFHSSTQNNPSLLPAKLSLQIADEAESISIILDSLIYDDEFTNADYCDVSVAEEITPTCKEEEDMDISSNREADHVVVNAGVAEMSPIEGITNTKEKTAAVGSSLNREIGQLIIKEEKTDDAESRSGNNTLEDTAVGSFLISQLIIKEEKTDVVESRSDGNTLKDAAVVGSSLNRRLGQLIIKEEKTDGAESRTDENNLVTKEEDDSIRFSWDTQLELYLDEKLKPPSTKPGYVTVSADLRSAAGNRAVTTGHTSVVSPNTRLIECKKCGDMVLNLRQHYQVMHLAARKFVCRLCDETFEDSGNLLGHIASISNSAISSKCKAFTAVLADINSRYKM